MMYSLDTSFVIRLLTGEPTSLFKLAAGFLDKAASQGDRLYLDNLVLAESYFALQFHYHFSKNDALDSLKLLVKNPTIEISPAAKSVLAMHGLATGKPGFVDLLIHAESRSNGNKLVTFEQASRKLDGTIVLK